MKHFSLLPALLLLTACAGEPESGAAPGGGQIQTQELYVPGVFRIKLRGTAAELDTRAFTRSGSGSGIAAFDAAATRAGATAVQRVFSDGDRFRERRRRAGLHLWYDVRFSGTISVEEAMERFGRVDEVECIEPVPRMVPADAAVVQVSSGPLGAAGPGNAAGSGFDDPLLVNQWLYRREGSAVGSTAVADLNIFPAWSVSTGHKDIIVAVVDGGIDYTHPDLAANIWHDEQGACGYNFCRHNTEITPSSHGTHVAGTIGAVNNNGIGVCGIAGGDGTPGSGVRLMSCQIFDEPGRDAATIEEIMTWTADHGAVISQNSWTYVPGLADLSQSGKAAIDYFIEYAGCDEDGNQTGPMKGGIVIFAAGNDGISDPVFPGAYEKVVAVASLGIDGRKVTGSNYGPWIDLAALGGHATGDERFRVFSTTLNGSYGYSAGTSMAAPQVSGIAALAVAAFGTQGPGFTSEKLREILVSSGRKQFTESINPEYAGMLGNGLVDAEYVLFHDAEPDPVDERTIAASGHRTHAELSWSVPRCYPERPVASFDVYADTRTFTAATVGDIPATAVRYTFASAAGLGETFTCRIEGLEPRQVYCLAIVSRSPSGVPSHPVVISVRTGENTAPEATAAIPNLFLQSDDKAGRSIDLSQHFTDADAPGDRLTFVVSSSAEEVVECRVQDSELLVLPRAAGRTTLTVTAKDLDGATATSEFQAIVDGTGAPMELFPNPCRDVLNVRIPGFEGDFPIRLHNAAGQQVLAAQVSVRAGNNGDTGRIDVSGLTPGTYTCTVECNGRKLSSHIIKR